MIILKVYNASILNNFWDESYRSIFVYIYYLIKAWILSFLTKFVKFITKTHYEDLFNVIWKS